MINVSGIRVPLVRAEKGELVALEAALARKLHVKPLDVRSFELTRRSIDARKRSDIQLVYSVRADIAGQDSSDDKAPISWPKAVHAPKERPIIVGAGCAGLFCALALAKAGLAPLVLERGDDAQRRSELVQKHNATGDLDLQSNIQFGLGGAGTFSDGKLATGTKSPYHHLILETFVRAGASPSVLFDAHPHVGSDVLPQVVTRIVEMIEDLGGEVRFRTRMTEIVRSGGRVKGVRVESQGHERELSCSTLVLASGHSARDVYEHLARAGFALERKTFAMGVRIEHLQASVDRALYGGFAGHPLLGAAPYKAAVHLPNERGAFSFCMCPGGEVVSAASEYGGVCTNGASLSARNGCNANAGFLANVMPHDVPGDNVLAGIELQRACEQAAFAAGGGGYVAPAQLVGDFLSQKPSSGPGTITPTYPRGVSWTSVDELLPSYIINTLREALPLIARRLPFFADENAVLTGVETRSSSPVRITRNDTLQATTCEGLYPIGEGAGYAGGIMSAATDGIRAATAICSAQP